MNRNIKIAKALVRLAKELSAADAAKEIKDVLFSMGSRQQISNDYWGRIAESIADDVVADIQETADEEWSQGDMLLAVGRALCKRLGIDY